MKGLAKAISGPLPLTDSAKRFILDVGRFLKTPTIIVLLIFIQVYVFMYICIYLPSLKNR